MFYPDVIISLVLVRSYGKIILFPGFASAPNEFV